MIRPTNRKAVRINKVIIGFIEKRTFVKTVKASCHMLREPRAWCIDSKAFDEQIEKNADLIVVLDMEAKMRYETTTELFRQKCGTIDRGFGLQSFLVLKHWTCRPI